ncbi:P-selectin-like [Panulirus ornatus]|uniref:P-selectin-like n=1 Tax=Panulirus ornatus TaxID=150431 RepID=UPI003A8ACBF0
MKYREILGIFIYVCTYPGLSQGLECPYPAVPINSRVSVSSRTPASVATYSCDPGYKLFGSASVTCGIDGKWAGDLPICATNVAWKKPVNQSSTARGGKGENANDGYLTTVHDGQHCTETLVESSPWWSVDLLQEYEVTVIRISTRGCCGHQPLQDIEIRVGDSYNIQRNRLCSWFPGTIEEGTTKELRCARPMRGRYLFVQMVGVQGSMSLCEVEVYSTQEFSEERCSDKAELTSLTIFNQTCYELQITEGGDFERGREYCQNHGGDLIHNMGLATHKFLMSELERVKDKIKTNLIWIGAQKDPQFISRTWRWVNGEVIENPRWGQDQPNNYNGEQKCVVLDGGREWKWNDVGCELNYLHWICQFQPTSCGSPDLNENTTIGSTDTSTGATITYQCPVGNVVLGDSTRTCLSNGFWSGKAPECKFVDCEAPPEIENGSLVLVDGRTTYGGKVVYECEKNFTLNGENTATCSESGKWSPEAPQCLYSWCPELTAPAHGKVEMSGRRSGDIATFICEPGYSIQGTKTVSCSLGGEWSGEAPLCKFVDCGVPDELWDGKMTLVNSTTYLESVAKYECGDDYWLDGPMERVCLDDGQWSDVAPVCVLVACEEPLVPHGGYVTGYSFDVHEEVEYHCELGHFLTGDNIRVCMRDGEWSGEIPTCTFVDCGRVPTLSRGDVLYLNESTYLDSYMQYVCNNNYRLIGEDHRVCRRDSLWSGEAPKCEEIRCPEPELPPKTKTTITGNDRRMFTTVYRRREHVTLDNTYRVGSVATYRCDRGHVVDGQSMRTCLSNGTWNHKPPTCNYVDCGLPEALNPGTFRLLSNSTSYGSQVSYECTENWKLEGRIRRFCQANGTWVGETPKCVEVLCPDLTADLSEALSVDQGDLRVGTVATYSCEVGRTLVGKVTRECRTHGIWSGTQPRCECKTSLFYFLCSLLVLYNEPIMYPQDSFYGDVSDLRLSFTWDLPFCSSRRQQKGKEQEPPTSMKPREEHPTETMHYGNLSDPTTGNNIYENIPDDIEEYADMSSGSYTTTPVHTYSNGHQPTYTNGMMAPSAGMTASLNRPSANAMRRPRLPPPQPPTVPTTTAGPTSVVTINGVTVSSNGS